MFFPINREILTAIDVKINLIVAKTAEINDEMIIVDIKPVFIINAIAIVTPLFIAFEISSNEFISIFLFFSSQNFSLIKSFSVGNLLKINSSKNFKLS